MTADAQAPKLFVGAGTNLHVDFVPSETSGEAAYWVVDTRKHKTEPLRVGETTSGDGWVFDTKSQPVPPPPPSAPAPSPRPYLMTVGATGQVLASTPIISPLELTVAALGGFGIVKWLGASWTAASLTGVGLPLGLIGLTYIARRLTAPAVAASAQ